MKIADCTECSGDEMERNTTNLLRFKKWNYEYLKYEWKEMIYEFWKLPERRILMMNFATSGWEGIYEIAILGTLGRSVNFQSNFV